MVAKVQAMNLQEWFLLILLSILWGGSFFFIGVAVKGLPPLVIVALRLLLAAMVLAMVVSLRGLRLPADFLVWRAFLAMGILNNVIPFCLIVWGQTRIASGLASILNATTPLFTVIAAHYLTRDERMSRLKLLGVLVGIAGVAVLIGRGTLHGIGDDLAAQVAILGAAVSYSLAGIYGRRFREYGLQPLVTATGQVTASSMILVPLVFLVHDPLALRMPGIGVWAAVAGLALVSTALAYILYFRILATAGATNVLLVTLLIPVSAIVLGTVFLNEQLENRHFLGMGLIGTGLLAIDGRLFRRATGYILAQRAQIAGGNDSDGEKENI